MNAIGYIRVSTEQQAGEDKYGAKAQREAIEAYAAENGYEIVGWKEDHMSGAKDDRPALNEILYGEVANPPVQAVIAFKTDRIARDTRLYFYYLYLLEKKGIKLLSTLEDYDEYGEFASVIQAMMQFVAEQERKNITLRTSLGRKQKKDRGGYSGGRAPFGYMVQNKELVINEDEAPAVRRLFKLRDDGAGLTDIVRTLSSEGYTSRKGLTFSLPGLKCILENRKVYEGYVKDSDGNWIAGQQEAILDLDLID